MQRSFENEDDEDEQRLLREQLRKQQEKKRQLQLEEEQKLKQENPELYEYDSLYDSFHTKPAPKPQVSLKSAPKYMHSILQKNQERKKEQEIIKNRLQIKQMKKEGQDYEATEKFVTPSYLKKQQEQREWEEQQLKKEQEEDVTKKKSFNAFYTNIIETMSEQPKIKESSKQEIKVDSRDKHRDHRRDERSYRDYRDTDKKESKDYQRESSSHRHRDSDRHSRDYKEDKGRSKEKRDKSPKERHRESSHDSHIDKKTKLEPELQPISSQPTELITSKPEEKPQQPVPEKTKEEKAAEARARFLQRKQTPLAAPTTVENS